MQGRNSPTHCLHFWALFCAFLIILDSNGEASAAEGNEQPARIWTPKVGVLKNIVIEIPATAENKAQETVKHNFHLTVTGEENVAGKSCWKIVFIPGDKSPAISKQRLAIFVDKANGWPQKVTPIKSTTDARILKVGEASIVANGPLGVPIDLLPLIPSRRFQEGTATIDFQSSRSGNDIILELIYVVDGTVKLRIRQKWVAGDDWWRYYEKHVDETLVLRARAFDAPPLEDAFAKIPKPVVAAKADHPLRQDKRLYALVQIEPSRPAVGHVLRRIKAATGVEVVTSPELENHVPDLGFITPSPKGYLAWQLMEHLAKIEIEKAQWEKTPTGYRLTGVSKVPPGRILVTSDDPEPEPPPNRVTYWLLLSAGALAMVVCMLAAVLCLRGWRTAKQESASSELLEQDKKKNVAPTKK
jgi:hypothetical protein